MLRSHCVCHIRSAKCEVNFGAIGGKKLKFFKVFTSSHHVSPMSPRGCSEVVISLRGVSNQPGNHFATGDMQMSSPKIEYKTQGITCCKWFLASIANDRRDLPNAELLPRWRLDTALSVRLISVKKMRLHGTLRTWRWRCSIAQTSPGHLQDITSHVADRISETQCD